MEAAAKGTRQGHKPVKSRVSEDGGEKEKKTLLTPGEVLKLLSFFCSKNSQLFMRFNRLLKRQYPGLFVR